MEKKLNPDSTQQFYNALASDYHLVYKNWDQSMARQAKVIDQVIQKYARQKPQQVLDCTCGIGTQALGLSRLGYQVSGTDISPEAINRARKEAKNRNLQIEFDAVDVRNLAAQVAGQFDVVISFDNSLPHLTEKKDLLQAAKQILDKLKPNGLFIGSMRDYDQLLEQKPQSIKPVTSDKDGVKTITFQVWEWNEKNQYIVNHFTLRGKDEQFETSVRKAQYKAYSRVEMSTVFTEAGFQNIEWLLPDQTGFYQPIFIGWN